MSKILIYLHGLGSKGQSSKSDAVREALAPLGVSVFTPDLTAEPSEVIKLIDGLVQSLWRAGKLDKVVFCGTSLGGFFASYFGETFDAPFVAVNPVVRPSIGFRRYLAEPPKNWVDGGRIIFTEQTLADYSEMERKLEEPCQGNAHVFLAKDDDVIPYQYAASKWKHSHLTITDTGGHRYDVEWDLVIDRLKTLFA